MPNAPVEMKFITPAICFDGRFVSNIGKSPDAFQLLTSKTNASLFAGLGMGTITTNDDVKTGLFLLTIGMIERGRRSFSNVFKSAQRHIPFGFNTQFFQFCNKNTLGCSLRYDPNCSVWSWMLFENLSRKFVLQNETFSWL